MFLEYPAGAGLADVKLNTFIDITLFDTET